MNNIKHLKSFKHLCRLCLTQGDKMLFLDSPLNEENGPSILQVLEMIACTKVELNNNYPSVVCAECLKFLNVAYNLKLKFENSQKVLQNVFSNYENNYGFVENNTCEDESNYSFKSEHDLQIFKECENNEDVEIIYIKYTDIRENSELQHTKVDESEFENSEVSVISKTKMENKETEPFARSRKKHGKKQSINVDKYIIEHMDTNPVTADVKTLQNINDELIQAAHNLKYKCSACPKLYSSQRKFEKHKEGCKKLKYMSQFKNAAVNQNNHLLLLYECDKCSQVYTTVKELDNHRETTHDYSNMDTILKLKAGGLSEIDQELFRSALLLKYQCDSCTKVYSSLNRLSHHKAVCGKFKKKPKLM